MDMEEKKCMRCGHVWIPRVIGDPAQCPRCKSYKWKTAAIVKVRE
jgi:predicted Zn-ribbon and HTH transcriptional regulator